MRQKKRWLWLIGLAIGAIVLLTVLLAPGGSIERRGSTFSRAPDGYGAWFAYMQQQNPSVQRWQRSPADLLKETQPMTLLRVNFEMQINQLDSELESWIKRGNTLIELGVLAPVSRAPFATMQPSSQGEVKIETTRRQPGRALLGDQFGSIVWQEAIGKGQLIRATTPHLAANAYQNEPGNFAFLAQLMRQGGDRLFVDEALHGYGNSSVADTEAETAGSWAAYLAKTPLMLILIQGIVLFLVVLWAENRRFGAPVSIAPPPIDNSEAYIQALAGVLHKAGRSEFLLDAIGKVEQLHIQRALGLGMTAIDPKSLRTAWQQQTARPASDLDAVLNPPFADRRASDQDLLTWLQAIRTVRQHLP